MKNKELLKDLELKMKDENDYLEFLIANECSFARYFAVFSKIKVIQEIMYKIVVSEDGK